MFQKKSTRRTELGNFLKKNSEKTLTFVVFFEGEGWRLFSRNYYTCGCFARVLREASRSACSYLFLNVCRNQFSEAMNLASSDEVHHYTLTVDETIRSDPRFSTLCIFLTTSPPSGSMKPFRSKPRVFLPSVYF